MGKKRVKEPRVNTAFMVEPSTLAELDYYAKKLGITRSLLIRNCVTSSLDDLRLLDKTGILSATRGGGNIIQAFKKVREISEDSTGVSG